MLCRSRSALSIVTGSPGLMAWWTLRTASSRVSSSSSSSGTGLVSSRSKQLTTIVECRLSG